MYRPLYLWITNVGFKTGFHGLLAFRNPLPIYIMWTLVLCLEIICFIDKLAHGLINWMNLLIDCFQEAFHIMNWYLLALHCKHKFVNLPHISLHRDSTIDLYIQGFIMQSIYSIYIICDFSTWFYLVLWGKNEYYGSLDFIHSHLSHTTQAVFYWSKTIVNMLIRTKQTIIYIDLLFFAATCARLINCEHLPLLCCALYTAKFP